MNIFVLDNDPVKAVQLQCDKHIVKMIVESAQMLSTTHRILDGKMTIKLSKSGKRKVKYWSMPDFFDDVFYKAVHMNHPCTVWTRECSANYIWHYDHFIALCDEYTFRYGKVHASFLKLGHHLKNLPKNIRKSDELTKFPLAMPDECKVSNDPVVCYRNYYQTKQDRFTMKWTGRSMPDWFIPKEAA